MIKYIILYFVVGFFIASISGVVYKKYKDCDMASLFVFVWIFWLPIILIGGFLSLLDWWLKIIGVTK